MKQILNVFNLKLIVLKNKLIHSTVMDAIKFFILSTFIIFYCWGGQYVIIMFFNKLREMPNLAEMLISKLWVSQILLLLFSAFTPFLIFGGMISFVPTFFNKKELTFNMVNNRSLFPLFAYNYFEVIFKNFAFILIAIAPLLIAYGKLFDVSYNYFISAPVVIFLFAVVLVSFGIFISFGIMRVAPDGKVIAAINFATMIASMFLIYYLILSNPVNIIGKDFVNQLLKYARQLKEPASSFKISVMTNLIFTGIVYNKSELVIINALKLLGMAIFAIGVNLVIGYYVFSKKIISVMEESGSSIFSIFRISSKSSPASLKAVKKYPLVFKEIMYLLRDQTILLQILTIVVLAVAFIINILKVSNLDRASAIFYVRLSYPATVLLLTVFAGRLVFPSVSSEGRNIWLIKLSPFGIKKFIYTKFFLLFFMQFVFSMIFLLTVNFISGYKWAIYVVFNFAFLVSVIMTTTGFVLGILLADFSESDPWRIATGLGGVLFFIASFAFSLFPILLAVISYGHHGYRMKVVYFSFIISAISVLIGYFILNKMIRYLELKEI